MYSLNIQINNVAVDLFLVYLVFTICENKQNSTLSFIRWPLDVHRHNK